MCAREPHAAGDHLADGRRRARTIIITHVVPGSPAGNTALRPGDRIYQVAGRDFADEAAFVNLAKAASDSLQLLVERDGRLRTVVLNFHDGSQERAA